MIIIEKFELTVYKKYIDKWLQVLKLQDWDIILFPVEKEWKKASYIQIDDHDKRAVLMINVFQYSMDEVEEHVLTQLIHVKLWEEEYILDDLLGESRLKDKTDPSYHFEFQKYMEALSLIIIELTNRYLKLSEDANNVSYKDFFRKVEKEISIKK